MTILDHASKPDGGTHGYAKHGATFRLRLELMLATGLRVGDPVAFDPRVLAVPRNHRSTRAKCKDPLNIEFNGGGRGESKKTAMLKPRNLLILQFR